MNSKTQLNFLIARGVPTFCVQLFLTFMLTLIGLNTNEAKKAKSSSTMFSSCQCIIWDNADIGYHGNPHTALELTRYIGFQKWK